MADAFLSGVGFLVLKGADIFSIFAALRPVSLCRAGFVRDLLEIIATASGNRCVSLESSRTTAAEINAGVHEICEPVKWKRVMAFRNVAILTWTPQEWASRC